MKVRENLIVSRKVMKKLKGERFSSKTWTVTRLLQCPRKAYYRMISMREIAPESLTLIFARGRALHTELEKAFKFREIHKEVDGIRGDIDAIGDRVVEIYSTRLGSKKVEDANKIPDVFRSKVRQLMAYCYMIGERSGDLLVFFTSGDYSRFVEVLGKKVYTGIRPELKCWTLEFTEEELKKNWKQMLDNKEEIELAFKDGIPPLSCGEEWECNNCGYSYKCLGDEPVTKKTDVIEGMML